MIRIVVPLCQAVSKENVMPSDGPAGEPPARSKRADAQRNRQTVPSATGRRVLTAAAEVFVTSGVDAPIRQIAARAGVGMATMYRRFPTRADLVRGDDGLGTCGPGCGVAIDFTCRRCGSPADISTDGCCTRCVASDRVHELLADQNGQVTEVLVPLAQALTAAPRPRSVMAWLRRSPSAHLLAALAASQAEITHERLNDVPQEPATRYVRELLVHAEILPTRQENLVQLELWFRDAAQNLPTAHTEIIRPFAEWFIIRDARRRAARGRYSPKAAHTNRGEVPTGESRRGRWAMAGIAAQVTTNDHHPRCAITCRRAGWVLPGGSTSAMTRLCPACARLNSAVPGFRQTWSRR
ncbi:hypothetical protein M2271_005693 [Streptomyces sp. LBL]|nr:hypothetical protein [Streptomyces sp. LBL]